MNKMWAPVLIISLVVLSAGTIKVPVETSEDNQTELIPINTSDLTHNKPIYYIQDEEKVDGYVIPPSPYRLEEIDEAVIEPATYLVPPPPGKQTDYYLKPTEPDQTDWYPIASNEPQKQSDVTVNLQPDNPKTQREFDRKFRNGKELERGHVSLPHRSLVPPAINSQNDFIILTPSSELELPFENGGTSNIKPTHYQKHFSNPPVNTYPAGLRHNKIHLLPYLIPPPKNLPLIYPKPTKLFPKKFSSEYKPIPIPINQYNDDSLDEVPMARPVKPFKPKLSTDIEHLPPSEEKNIYLFEKAENKRRLKEEHNNAQIPSEYDDTSDRKFPVEQDASESNYRHPGRNMYPAPLKQAPPTAPPRPNHAASNGDRTEFRMHGMKGPHSYQFGYDTGKGKNRQFRYEERDNEGNVKGHYGYVDNHGKLRVVNYDADPEHGFRAETPVEQDG